MGVVVGRWQWPDGLTVRRRIDHAVGALPLALLRPVAALRLVSVEMLT